MRANCQNSLVHTAVNKGQGGAAHTSLFGSCGVLAASARTPAFWAGVCSLHPRTIIVAWVRTCRNSECMLCVHRRFGTTSHRPQNPWVITRHRGSWRFEVIVFVGMARGKSCRRCGHKCRQRTLRCCSRIGFASSSGERVPSQTRMRQAWASRVSCMLLPGCAHRWRRRCSRWLV